MNELRDALQALAMDRGLLADLKAQEQAAQAALEATPEYQALAAVRAYRQKAEFAVEQESAAVRDYTLIEFKRSGDKSPANGVTVKLYKKLRYNNAVIFDWLMGNAPALLTIDTRRFEKSAETLGAPVEVDYEPRPTIATDLSEYLPEFGHPEPDTVTA